ncbi:hypothetical protein GQ53DRAFT_850049 [Thozetella sp. PMI_491]|nr:hypothetical protein GQ53DRAFT_850049 [Thozetella sp. PMI_491]
MSVGITAHGNAANVAETVNAEKQEINIGSKAETVSMRNKSRKEVNSNNREYTSYTYNNYNYNAPRNNLPASRVIGVHLPPDAPLTWSLRDRRFSSLDDESKEVDQINHRWNRTLPLVEELDEALSGFRAASPGNDSEALSTDTGEEPLDLKDMKKGILGELKRARKYYRRGSLKQDPLALVVRKIEKDIDPFFLLLGSLVGNEHRSSLYRAIHLMLKGVGDSTTYQDFGIECLQKCLTALCCAPEYLGMSESHRRMMGETVDIFEGLAGLLIQFLNIGDQKLSGTEKDSIERNIDEFRLCLMSANDRSRDLQKPPQDINFLPSQIDGGDLNIVNTYLILYASTPNLPQNHGASMVLRSLGDEKQRQSSLTSAGIAPSELLTYLPYNSRARTADIENCNSHAQVAPVQMQRLSSLTRKVEFQAWLKEVSQSSALLVHGNFGASKSITPLSYLCAQIAKQYDEKEGFLVLTYFCSLHADVYGPKSTSARAATIISDMIGQILSHPESSSLVYNSESIDRNLLKNIKKQDYKTLSKVFVELVRELRQLKMVVLCLIDSISRYEVPSREKETQSMLEMLEKVVNSQRGNKRSSNDKMVFKLMITDGARSLFAHKYFQPDEKIEVTQNIVGSGLKRLELGCN